MSALKDDPDRPGKQCFKCPCGRIQAYAPKGERGGCTEDEAETIGWRLINGEWQCPYCTGNTANLDKVFKRSDP